MNDGKITSKFYIFSVKLWDYLIGNGLFLLFNIMLPLFFLIFKTDSPLLLFVFLYLLSLNIIPSLTALTYTYLRKKEDHESVIKLFMKGYKKSFSVAFKGGLVFVGIFYILVLDYIYFSQKNLMMLAIFFALMMIVLAYFVFSFILIQAQFNFTVKESIILSLMYFKELNKGVLFSLIILLIFLYLVRAKVYIGIGIMFALMSKALINKAHPALDLIYENHTEG